MEKPYHLVEKDDRRGWASFRAKNGQALLPMIRLATCLELSFHASHFSHVQWTPGRPSLPVLQSLAGHANPETTTQYIGKFWREKTEAREAWAKKLALLGPTFKRPQDAPSQRIQ